MPRCLSSLFDIPEEGYTSPAARELAGGRRKFPHRLTFNRSDVIEFRLSAAEHMSISGVQDKISLRLERGRLLPTERDGEYILKPVPCADIPRLKDDVPANENLTMQLASQVFGIATAANACILFADGEQAYITKRFDRREDGSTIAQEDFCQLSNRTEETRGRNYKYDGTYEEAGRILKHYCKAYAVEIEKLFRLIVFNYACSNGDAHLKNFSLYRTAFGDYIMTPAYDLIASGLHFPQESRTALDLFDTLETEYFRANGFYGRPDFLELARLYGMDSRRAMEFLDAIAARRHEVTRLIDRSFMSAPARQEYKAGFEDRLKTLIP
ncbi:HipA domain-containing protein [Verrucomicrobiota bacterium]